MALFSDTYIPHRQQTTNKHIGFTLIEVIVSITLIAILAAISIVSLSSMLDKNRLRKNMDALTSNIEFARAQAQRTGCRTQMTFSQTSAGLEVKVSFLAPSLLNNVQSSCALTTDKIATSNTLSHATLSRANPAPSALIFESPSGFLSFDDATQRVITFNSISGQFAQTMTISSNGTASVVDAAAQ
jgi:prepilin-type N-terminal cleavage/methylation domain-containing protein